MFEKETGRSINYESLARNQDGKPLPIDGVYFNISHSGNYWCILFSDAECGIDIEINRPLKARLARKILSPSEKLINGNLMRNWVIKEAYAKMVGTGIGVGFSSINAADILEKYAVSDLSTDEYICYAIGKDKTVEIAITTADKLR